MKMMLDSTEALLISSCDERGILINGQWWQQTILISRETLTPLPELQTVEDISLASMQPALALAPELVLLGCGESHRFAPPALAAALAGHGCPLESMTTAAASRTYNVLVGEHRHVAALLLPVGQNRPPEASSPGSV